MAQRSLLDDGDFGSIGKRSGGGGGGGSKMDTAMMVKIGVIIVCFIGAGLGLAYYNGLFDAPRNPPPTPEERRQMEEELEKQQKENERLLKMPGYESGDA